MAGSRAVRSRDGGPPQHRRSAETYGRAVQPALRALEPPLVVLTTLSLPSPAAQSFYHLLRAVTHAVHSLQPTCLCLPAAHLTSPRCPLHPLLLAPPPSPSPPLLPTSSIPNTPTPPTAKMKITFKVTPTLSAAVAGPRHDLQLTRVRAGSQAEQVRH